MGQSLSCFDVTIVTVAFNSSGVLPEMLSTVPDGTSVVIVDNGSDDQEATALLAKGYGAVFLGNIENQGFGRACNQGAAVAKTRFLLFLNPDARLAPDAIDAFLTAAVRHPQASGFNPRILNRHGEMVLRRRSKFRPDLPEIKGTPADDVAVPILHGSAIFTARDTFAKVEGFDPAIFLYHEDDDLALRLRNEGPLMLCYDAQVTHLEGRSSARTAATAYFKAYHMARSRIYVYLKHGRRGASVRTTARAFFGLLSPLNLSPRKAAKAWGFLRGALSAVPDKGRYNG